MPRRLVPLLALLAAVLVACGGTSAAPALTDPKDILTHAITATDGVKSFHLKVSLDGKIDPSLLTGALTSPAPDASSSGATFSLAGTTLEGDVDAAGSKAKLSASVPALIGLSADLVAADSVIYLRTSLTGDKYSKLDPSTLAGSIPGMSLPPVASANPSGLSSMLDQLKTELDSLSTPPTKLADEKVGDQDCYHVQLKIASSDLPSEASSLAGASGSATVDVWTRKSDYRPAKLTFAVDAGTTGTLSLTVELSNYDAAVTITAPPADQVSDQPFSLPGLTP